MEIKVIDNKRLKELRTIIIARKKLLLCLSKRIILIRENYSVKSEYEKNEVDIMVHNTTEQIIRVTQNVKELEEQFFLELKNYISDIEDLVQNYEAVLNQCKEKQKEITPLKHLLYYVNWKYIDENVEEKIILYKNMKEILWENSPKPYDHLKNPLM